MKITPENMFILFIFRVFKFWRGEEKKDKTTPNAAFSIFVVMTTQKELIPYSDLVIE